MNRVSNGQLVLDLFCGAGGAAMGYYRAGYDVIGIDNQPQSRFPFRFEQMDWLEGLQKYGRRADVIHASPPCQAYSRMRRIKRNQHTIHPDLIAPVRDRICELDTTYVIENVEGAPLIDPLRLCGLQFNLRVYRHRLFESSELLLGMQHGRHNHKAVYAGPPNLPLGSEIKVYDSASKTKLLGPAMGIDWMSRDEIAQAIPPAYTEYIARQLIQ